LILFSFIDHSHSAFSEYAENAVVAHLRGVGPHRPFARAGRDRQGRPVNQTVRTLGSLKHPFNLNPEGGIAVAGISDVQLPGWDWHFRCQFENVPDLSKTFRSRNPRSLRYSAHIALVLLAKAPGTMLPACEIRSGTEYVSDTKKAAI
jgi:hypothetical protein